MKILVLSQDYPSMDKPYAMSYVHSRNIEYQKHRHQVKVINFASNAVYQYDSLEVSPFNEELLEWADIIISHAPNLKNHVRALQQIQNKKIIFFFHGHEVLHQYGDYPAPFSWKRENLSKKLFIKMYDHLKMIVLKRFLKKIATKNSVGCIFVSEWMQRQFVKNIQIDPQILGRSRIIPNACNSVFLDLNYEFDSKNTLADSITIRPLDDSKYAVDLVVQAAINNPEKKFHIYGKGNYFQINEKPQNVTVINQFIQQKDIPELLNKYQFAMMPTRYDAQGVMVCEMATYGIPVITTDFEVCVEMLREFDNVKFVSEDEFSTLKCKDVKSLDSKHNKFSPEILIKEELGFFDEL